jgi:hypothetical protein
MNQNALIQDSLLDDWMRPLVSEDGNDGAPPFKKVAQPLADIAGSTEASHCFTLQPGEWSDRAGFTIEIKQVAKTVPAGNGPVTPADTAPLQKTNNKPQPKRSP